MSAFDNVLRKLESRGMLFPWEEWQRRELDSYAGVAATFNAATQGEPAEWSVRLLNVLGDLEQFSAWVREPANALRLAEAAVRADQVDADRVGDYSLASGGAVGALVHLLPRHTLAPDVLRLLLAGLGPGGYAARDVVFGHPKPWLLNELSRHLGPGDVPLLERLLNDAREEPELRALAAGYRLTCGGVVNDPALLARLARDEKQPRPVRQLAAEQWWRVGDAEALAGVRKLVLDGKVDPTEGFAERADHLDWLLHSLAAPLPGERLAAARMLAQVGWAAVDALTELVRTAQDWRVLTNAQNALAAINREALAVALAERAGVGRGLSRATPPTGGAARGLSRTTEAEGPHG